MASRKEQKEQARQERLAAEQADQQKHQRQRTYGIVAGAVLVVGVIIAVIVIAASGGKSSSTTKKSGSYAPAAEFAGAVSPPPKGPGRPGRRRQEGWMRAEEPADRGQHARCQHQEAEVRHQSADVRQYDSTPQPDGVYTKYPQPRHTVHSLEGGRVEIQYDPELDKKQIAQLGGIFNADNLYLAMYPNPDMPYAVAVTAWATWPAARRSPTSRARLHRALPRPGS